MVFRFSLCLASLFYLAFPISSLLSSPHCPCPSPCSAERAEEWGREAGRGDSDGDELEDKGVAEVEERAEAPVGRARLRVDPPEHTWKGGSNKQQ